MTPVLPTRQVPATAAPQHQLAFSSDGAYVAVNPILSGGYATIHLTESGERIGSLSDELASLDFAGGTVLVASRFQTASVWQLPALERVAQLNWSEDDLFRGKYVPDLGLFALLGQSLLRCWDVRSWNEVIRHMPAPGERHLSIFSESGRLFSVSLTQPQQRKKWHIRELAVTDLESGKRDVLTEIPYCVESFRFSHDGAWAVICEVIDTGRYDIWNFRARSISVSLTFDWKLLPCYSFSSACGYLVQSYQHSPGAWIWDLNTGELIRQFDQLSPLHLCSAPFQPLFAAFAPSADEHEKTVFANARTGKIAGVASGHVVLMGVAYGFSPCGRWFGSVSNDYLSQPLPSGTLLLSDLGAALNHIGCHLK